MSTEKLTDLQISIARTVALMADIKQKTEHMTWAEARKSEIKIACIDRGGHNIDLAISEVLKTPEHRVEIVLFVWPGGPETTENSPEYNYCCEVFHRLEEKIRLWRQYEIIYQEEKKALLEKEFCIQTKEGTNNEPEKDELAEIIEDEANGMPSFYDQWLCAQLEKQDLGPGSGPKAS